jgi:hypothetical protein
MCYLEVQLENNEVKLNILYYMYVYLRDSVTTFITSGFRHVLIAFFIN